MKSLTIANVLFLVVMLSACAGSKPARSVEFSGFLEDYSILREGNEGEATYLYINPNVQPGSYDKILLDPVTLWHGPESRATGVSQKDAQFITDYFYTIAHDKLSQDYKMVREPGSGTMRISVALTKVEEANVTMGIVSTVIPLARVTSLAKDVLTGKPSFVGEAAIEARITDAETGELLAAGVDRRVGGKELNASEFESWNDVQNIMQFWVNRLSYQLCKRRGKTDCVPPEA